ncbi:MAG TPA: hypothetical protein DCZ03_10365 [Gammaproteobacteria bacterium]|nr:hypothetical protein [Gammaproteobacteria bacterium]
MKLSNGVNLTVINAEEIQGEYDTRSFFYVLTLWLVSCWSMFTNSVQLLYLKLFRYRKKYFQKIMWEMGRDSSHVSRFFFDRFSHINHRAKYGAADWRSLDLFYNYHTKVKPSVRKNLEGFLTHYWMEKMENRQAVTNRFKIVVNLLSDAFCRFEQESEIRVLSIASGSAQAVIAAIKKNPDLNIKAVLIDNDKTAIDISRQNVKEAGLEDHFEFVLGTTRKIEEVCEQFHPHIIEMVGLMDYLTDTKAIRTVSRIRNCLPENGVFLTGNIRHNREMLFLFWVLLWPMIYRTEEQLSKVMTEAGFSSEQVSLYYEPFMIHGVAMATRGVL